MGKKSLYTNVTPLPSNIPRQLAIDMLHNHGEIIELNPLVLSHKQIDPPKNASADEYFAVWHEVTERIQYIPGMGKMASGKVSFKGCFHDMPWGLQTHIYAPMGLDVRNKWQIRGNQPGEQREVRELGQADVPHDGLYIREDVEFTCNRTLIPFVKKELKAACAVLVDRLIRKAELLDAGVLQAMMENGRLKTVNPSAVRNSTMSNLSGGIPGSPRPESQYTQGPHSPLPSQMVMSPQMANARQSLYYEPKMGYAGSPGGLGIQHEANRQSGYFQYPDQGPGQPQPQPQPPHGYYQNHPAYARQSQYGAVPPPRQFVAELSGSTYFPSAPSPNFHHNPDRDSSVTELSGSSPTQDNFSSPYMGGSNRSDTASELPAKY